jgi:hypothetical protein
VLCGLGGGSPVGLLIGFVSQSQVATQKLHFSCIPIPESQRDHSSRLIDSEFWQKETQRSFSDGMVRCTAGVGRWRPAAHPQCWAGCRRPDAATVPGRRHLWAAGAAKRSPRGNGMPPGHANPLPAASVARRSSLLNS